MFYGWYIVATTLLLTTYNSAMFVYGFTTFITPITNTFGWTYAQVSIASSIRGLETGSLDPLIGMVADRWSARKLILIGILILVIGVICLSQTTNLAMFYAAFLILGLGSAIGIHMVPTTVTARWFKKNIGKASGILAAGIAAGGLFAPLVVEGIDAYGWQNLLLYLAFGLLVMGVPLSFVYRNRPEDYGLLPDGETPASENGPRSYDISTGVREALKARTFWFIGVASMFQMAGIHSVAIHLMPHLTSLGMERSSAAIAVTVFSVVSIVSRIIYGVLADIFSKRRVFALSLGLTITGLVIFGLIDGNSFAQVILFAVVYGAGSAGATPLRAPLVREYFGVKNFGTIFGLFTLFIMLGNVIGAPIAGWVYDTRGEYNPIWFIFAGLIAVGMIIILMLPPASEKLSPEVG